MQHPPKKTFKRKSRKRLWLLTGAALVLSAALVVLLPVIRRQFPAEKLAYEINESTVRTLASYENNQLESVTLLADGQNGYTLVMHNGALCLEQGGSFTAVDPDDQTQILETVTQISVQDTVLENADEATLAAMGLLPPQSSAIVRYADGREERLDVGSQVHGGTDYYFRWSGAEGVYTCHSGVPEIFGLAQNLLIPVEQPVIYGVLLQRLSIANANGACTLLFGADGSASLAEPCAYPVAQEKAESLLNAMQNFRLGAYEAPLTPENSAAYGFDDPLCILEITQREGAVNVIGEDGGLAVENRPAQSMQLVFGRAESDFFYTCAYQDHVYLVSRFLAETLVGTNWQQVVSRTPAAMGDRALSAIVLEKGEHRIDMRIARSESVLANNELERDAMGETVYVNHITVNGAEAPQERLDELLDRLNAFAAEGDVPADAVLAQEPRWRITLTAEDGETRILEGYRMDVFSDAVAVNGVICHYVYAGAIDVLMEGLE